MLTFNNKRIKVKRGGLYLGKWEILAQDVYYQVPSN